MRQLIIMVAGLTLGACGNLFGWDVIWPFALAFLSIILITRKHY